MTSKTNYDTRIKFKLNSRKYGLLYVCKHFAKSGGGGAGGVTITHHVPIFLSYHASRKIYLRKSEVGEQEKRARSWCHNYLLSRSLLLVSNDINHHGNFKGNSRVTCCEIVNHASSCYTQSRLTRLGPITHHAENMGPITNHGKALHPVLGCDSVKGRVTTVYDTREKEG